jgi:hypothetical protein
MAGRGVEAIARLLNVGRSAADAFGRQAVRLREALDERRCTLAESRLLLRVIGGRGAHVPPGDAIDGGEIGLEVFAIDLPRKHETAVASARKAQPAPGRWAHIHDPVKSAKPPPPVQIRAAPPLSPRNQSSFAGGTCLTGRCARIVPAVAACTWAAMADRPASRSDSVVRLPWPPKPLAAKRQPDRGVEGVQLLRGFNEIAFADDVVALEYRARFCGRSTLPEFG